MCLGPIEAPDTHKYCIPCLGLAHVEAALDFSWQCPIAASEPLVGMPHGSIFLKRVFDPPALEIISFSAAGDDSFSEDMSLTASKKDLAKTPEERSEVERPTAFQDELVRILTRAVSYLGLEWESPDEPVKSKLDSWFLSLGCQAAVPRKPICMTKSLRHGQRPSRLAATLADLRFSLKSTKRKHTVIRAFCP